MYANARGGVGWERHRYNTVRGGMPLRFRSLLLFICFYGASYKVRDVITFFQKYFKLLTC